MPDTFPDETALPDGWLMREPDERDLAVLAELRADVHRAATGSASPDVATVVSEVTLAGSWTRRQVVAVDPAEVVRAWAAVHDRAAGRTLVHVTVEPGLDVEDAVASALFAWVERVSLVVPRRRRLPGTQIDTGAFAADARQQRWLAAAGYRHTRTWLQMSRPVTGDEHHPGVLTPPRPGVRVRRVRRRTNGLPLARDVQAIHQVLEESFADHFNSYRESFPEFVHRLQEDPGHAWDQWWLAVIDVDGREVAGGALVGSVLAPDADGVAGSYVDYIGVDRVARGRGVAKALLNTAISDAAERGRNRIGLEVDDDSPTGADGLYRSLGWETSYVTQSWHRDVTL
ncbi:GNAT family N-acetyltransferase [Agilicoccus flavus]|uniref:GNAT family N-acetyltransferase n=1 Tax=Agilicoccus flavus TaxID=2775968 RepID=UPI001CF643C0|nr:GNAT family N-acetyltransferase [Agilicoccus flavus]